MSFPRKTLENVSWYIYVHFYICLFLVDILVSNEIKRK